jgi:hypothetical protein
MSTQPRFCAKLGAGETRGLDCFWLCFFCQSVTPFGGSDKSVTNGSLVFQLRLLWLVGLCNRLRKPVFWRQHPLVFILQLSCSIRWSSKLPSPWKERRGNRLVRMYVYLCVCESQYTIPVCWSFAGTTLPWRSRRERENCRAEYFCVIWQVACVFELKN